MPGCMLRFEPVTGVRSGWRLHGAEQLFGGLDTGVARPLDTTTHYTGELWKPRYAAVLEAQLSLACDGTPALGGAAVVTFDGTDWTRDGNHDLRGTLAGSVGSVTEVTLHLEQWQIIPSTAPVVDRCAACAKPENTGSADIERLWLRARTYVDKDGASNGPYGNDWVTSLDIGGPGVVAEYDVKIDDPDASEVIVSYCRPIGAGALGIDVRLKEKDLVRDDVYDPVHVDLAPGTSQAVRHTFRGDTRERREVRTEIEVL